MHGTNDHVVPHVTSQRMADRLAAAGVAVDHREFGSLIHGFANFFPAGGDSATATTEAISALRAHLART